ncbi:MAG: glycosyltransferase family 2 protein [Nitrosomonas sp.]
MTSNSPATVSVCAIIVTYHPDLTTLERLLSTLTQQVAMVVIVDNNSATNCVTWINKYPHKNVTSLALSENVGVAEGHNRGIRWAKNHGFTYVILFDQDSIPFPNMVEQLLLGEAELLQRGEQIAAVGPQYHDLRHTEPAPFIRFAGLRSTQIGCKNGANELHQADFLITSGMLIKLSAMDVIGLMDTDLFIDYVDVEWCLRARSMKYLCFGICSAKMHHSLGDRVVSLPKKNRIIPVHSPLRNYYLIRNAILLYKRKYVPPIWSFCDAYRLLLKFGVFSLLIQPRFLNFQMMVIGFWHGVRNIKGKFTATQRSIKSNKKPESE